MVLCAWHQTGDRVAIEYEASLESGQRRSQTAPWQKQFFCKTARVENVPSQRQTFEREQDVDRLRPTRRESDIRRYSDRSKQLPSSAPGQEPHWSRRSWEWHSALCPTQTGRTHSRLSTDLLFIDRSWANHSNHLNNKRTRWWQSGTKTQKSTSCQKGDLKAGYDLVTACWWRWSRQASAAHLDGIIGGSTYNSNTWTCWNWVRREQSNCSGQERWRSDNLHWWQKERLEVSFLWQAWRHAANETSERAELAPNVETGGLPQQATLDPKPVEKKHDDEEEQHDAHQKRRVERTETPAAHDDDNMGRHEQSPQEELSRQEETGQDRCVTQLENTKNFPRKTMSSRQTCSGEYYEEEQQQWHEEHQKCNAEHRGETAQITHSEQDR